MQNSEYMEKELDKIIKKYKIKSICDYGCGNGELLQQFQKKYGSKISYMGIDYFSKMGKDQRPKKSKGITYIDKNSKAFKELCSKGRKFDLIITIATVHHFKLPVGEMRTMEKLLKTKGILFMEDGLFDYKAKANFGLYMYHFAGEALYSCTNDFIRKFYSFEEVLDLVSATNLKIVKKAPRIKFTVPKKRMEAVVKGLIKSVNDEIIKGSYLKKIKPLVLRLYFKKVFAANVKLLKELGLGQSIGFSVTLQK